MKQFSDLCKNVASLQILVDVDTEYTAILADDEIKKYYAFAHHINIPLRHVSTILRHTRCEVIDSVKRIWQLFLNHRKYAKRVGYNPYSTGEHGVEVVQKPACA